MVKSKGRLWKEGGVRQVMIDDEFCNHHVQMKIVERTAKEMWNMDCVVIYRFQQGS